MAHITPHTFHIPVMGTGYTIESPIKVAHLGISSVIPLADHRLVENMRELHSTKNNLPFTPIGEWEEDGRAKSITGYLDLVHDLVEQKVVQMKTEDFKEGTDLTKYFELLPERSSIKQDYLAMLKAEGAEKTKLQAGLRDKIVPGNIDVNIMTKLDGINFTKENEPLPQEYNDAHAALRGFAQSKLNASVVLSAGMNPRLFGYMATFNDFFPDANGNLNKRIILKVSDYRSAMIQGRFLAKKGLWVSEFRIESGLNCGGHAFASDGYLLGPILKEFKEQKSNLIKMLHNECAAALLKEKEITVAEPMPVYFTVQGGVGDADEHAMFLDHYNMESVGWGSPFMLVPDAVTIDDFTLELCRKGNEDDFYLSDISPLGVPFNSIKGNLADTEKEKKVEAGKPGASCLKKHLEFNTEYTQYPICTASRKYQKTKIQELKDTISDKVELKKRIDKVVEKACLCVGLGNTVLFHHKLTIPKGNHGVVVCPGPNLAYFHKIASLKEMVDHIYGRTNTLFNADRPNVFIKELKIYIDYLKHKIDECSDDFNAQQVKYFNTFRKNLQEGITYYREMFSTADDALKNMKERVLEDLSKYKQELETMFVPA